MPKNIVICCDGTGNEFNPQSNSNVVKLCSTLVINQDQLSYYHPGVGTMGSPTANSWLGKEWSRVIGLAFGGGFFEDIGRAYQYLMYNYNEYSIDGQTDHDPCVPVRIQPRRLHRARPSQPAENVWPAPSWQ